MDEVKRRLDDTTALIEYFILRDKILILYISPDTSCLSIQNLEENFNKMIINFKKSISRIDDSNYIYYAHELYKLLLSPFENKIENKHLILIPHGILNYVPFEALLTKKTDIVNRNYRILPFLLKKNPITYDYSSTLHFLDSDSSSSQKTPTYYGFAPVLFN
jgi:CHAT domain-containing protein